MGAQPLRYALPALGLLFAGWMLASDEQAISTAAATQNTEPLSESTTVVPVVAEPAPPLAVDGYLVFDVVTGAVIAAEAIDEPRPIASITKLVTAATLPGRLDPESPVVVSPRDVETFGRAGNLTVGESYRARELLFPLLLESSNDAAAALLRAGGEEEYLRSMHEWAHAVGARNTGFADSSGLAAENVSTPRDLARILRALYSYQPNILDITRLSRYLGPYTGWSNNSPVFVEPGYRGGKHGYTEAAGLTIAGLFQEPLPSGPRTIGYVILDSDDLAADIATLRDFVQRSTTFE